MQPTKWDLILGQRPIPVMEHLLEEVSKLFAADLRRWPPELEAFEAATAGPLPQLLAQTPQRPEAPLYREAFRLTRWDLGRELDALDDYWRNQRWLEAGLAAKDKAMLLFLSRFMAEQLLGLQEATNGRVNRPRLLDVLSRTERHFERGFLP